MTRFVAVSSIVLWTTMAFAAPRAVVVPVVVGNTADPAVDLLTALGRGAGETATWTVVQGDGLGAIFETSKGLPAEERAAIETKLGEARAQLDATPSEAVTTLGELRSGLLEKSKTGWFAKEDFALLYGASGYLVAALSAAGQTDRAKATAAETTLLLPGRSPQEIENLPATATELLSAPPAGAQLILKSRPEGCDAFINGQVVGPTPAEIAVLGGMTYQASVSCAADADGIKRQSHPRRIVLGESETTRSELLDAEFERMFAAEGGRRLRFSSSQERRDLEDSYARRVAERMSADIVILASIGELGGSDWLNARLYLRSGYLNRQGLVRLEAARAGALGRYLATGRAAPGVLLPEDAGALVAASRGGPPREVTAEPWYTDIVGWSLGGVGLVGVGLGMYAGGIADDRTRQGDAIRGDSEQQQRFYREGSRWTFLSNIGLVGGGLMVATGVVLLAIPEYTGSQSELFVISPLPGGGAQVALAGRF